MTSDAAGVVAALRARDRCAEMLGVTVVAADAGSAVVEMSVRADMCNLHEICHGGMIFTLADMAMAFASNGRAGDSLATAASVEFLAPAREGDLLRATATERHLRGRNAIYDIAVTRDDGTPIALFRGRTVRVVAGQPEAS